MWLGTISFIESVMRLRLIASPGPSTVDELLGEGARSHRRVSNPDLTPSAHLRAGSIHSVIGELSSAVSHPRMPKRASRNSSRGKLWSASSESECAAVPHRQVSVWGRSADGTLSLDT